MHSRTSRSSVQGVEIDSDPDARTRLALAGVMLRLHEFEGAEKQLREVLSEDPEHAHAHAGTPARRETVGAPRPPALHAPL